MRVYDTFEYRIPIAIRRGPGSCLCNLLVSSELAGCRPRDPERCVASSRIGLPFYKKFLSEGQSRLLFGRRRQRLEVNEHCIGGQREAYRRWFRIALALAAVKPLNHIPTWGSILDLRVQAAFLFRPELKTNFPAAHFAGISRLLVFPDSSPLSRHQCLAERV